MPDETPAPLPRPNEDDETRSRRGTPRRMTWKRTAGSTIRRMTCRLIVTSTSPRSGTSTSPKTQYACGRVRAQLRHPRTRRTPADEYAREKRAVDSADAEAARVPRASATRRWRESAGHRLARGRQERSRPGERPTGGSPLASRPRLVGGPPWLKHRAFRARAGSF